VKQRILDYLKTLGDRRTIIMEPWTQEEHQLIYKGNVLEDHTRFMDISVSEGDHCMFLFNLKQKTKDEVQKTEQPVNTPEPIQPLLPQPQPQPQAQPQLQHLQNEQDIGGDYSSEGEGPLAMGDTPDLSDSEDETFVDANVAENIRDMIANLSSWLPVQQLPLEAQPQQPQEPPQQPADQPQPQEQHPVQIPAPAEEPQPQPPAPVQPQPPQPPQPQQLTNEAEAVQQFIQFIPFPEQELAMLVSMGFPDWRCRKALLLNYFDPEMALEWILTHSGDADVDAPLNEAQARQLLGALHNLQQAEVDESAAITSQIQECIKNNKCTYTVTHTEYAPQKWYYCYTCGLVDTEGVCESCAAVCHKTHKLSPIRESERFYCDCGAGAYNCICNK